MDTVQAVLNNPAEKGAYPYIKIAYNSLHAVYPPSMSEYTDYNSASSLFHTQPVDLSAFMPRVARRAGYGPDWPFDITETPLSGHVFTPNEPGVYPLAIFVHGQHQPWQDNSAKGYFYLCELLASHGIIAATINISYLTASTLDYGYNKAFWKNECGARPISVLEHIKQFAVWNATPSSYFHKKVDMQRIMLIGHSRGGEAVGQASSLNLWSFMKGDELHPQVRLDGYKRNPIETVLGPYGFNIRATLGIAPTISQNMSQYPHLPIPDNCFFIHGTRDRDVPYSEADEAHSIAHKVNIFKPLESTGKIKGVWRVLGANHNFFNTVWSNVDTRDAPVSRKSPAPLPGMLTTTPAPWAAETREALLTPEEQQETAKVLVGAMAQYFLLDKQEYKAFLQDHRLGLNAENRWFPAKVQLTSQYQDAERMYIQHNQEYSDHLTISAPLTGQVVVSEGVEAQRHPVDFYVDSPFNRFLVMRISWQGPDPRYTLAIDPIPWPQTPFTHLALTVAQAAATADELGQALDFSIEVAAGEHVAKVSISDYACVPYPDAVPDSQGCFGFDSLVMQTVRIPLQVFVAQGLVIRDLERISLVFDKRKKGALYCRDIQFTL
ncbi:S9 family peptidase [Pseudomonas sp. SDI]|uniref:alpha/beta hydrolase family protein n=1 Tax=Pseudomonas sp. SDI TaxID=2170734 RepID=UPI0010582F38|nr:alpha/beta hydrolase [Pseudomonas sp. SDI]